MLPFMVVRTLTLGLAGWVLTACYSYVAAPASGVRVGEHVRIRV